MKRIGSLFKKDIILGIKDVFVLLEMSFAVFIVLVLAFIIPEDIRTEGVAYIYDSTSIVEDFVLTNMPDADKRLGEYYVHSRDEVIEGMINDESAIGLLITANSNDTYRVQLLTQPYTKSGMVKYIDVDLEDLMAMLNPSGSIYPVDVYESVDVTALQRGLKDLLPFNQQILPPIMMYMIGIVGLFAMVSLVGQERSEATIRAFRVSPASMWEFIIRKHLVLLSVGIITFTILYLPMMGLQGYLESLLIIILTVLLGSSIGIILATFFDNPMSICYRCM